MIYLTGTGKKAISGNKIYNWSPRERKFKPFAVVIDGRIELINGASPTSARIFETFMSNPAYARARVKAIALEEHYA